MQDTDVTSIDFWDVGAADPSPLPMTTSDMSSHLIADWLPSLPLPVGSAFMDWPRFLCEPCPANGQRVLSIVAAAGRSERQWKGILSWMIGVAGARHVLKQLGYRWVAPMSAFYANAVQSVDFDGWHRAFPRTIVTAKRPASRTRLMPDHLALRSTGRRPLRVFDWAVVEAKGTQGCLTNWAVCPPDWYARARNVEIEVKGKPVTPTRNLVIATRANPNAVKRRTRCIQASAWNGISELKDETLGAALATEIVAAHLYGLFTGLRLPAWADAIVLSSEFRTHNVGSPRTDSLRQRVEDSLQRAEGELSRRGSSHEMPANDAREVTIEIGTEFEKPIEIDLSYPLMELARNICRADTPEAAEAAVDEADMRLDGWEHTRRGNSDERRDIVLPYGVEMRVPPEFNRRG